MGTWTLGVIGEIIAVWAGAAWICLTVGICGWIIPWGLVTIAGGKVTCVGGR